MTARIVPFDYEGQAVRFNADGWLHATQIAERFSKEPHEWLRLPDTQRYLEGLQRRYGEIPYVKTSRARADRGGGTWLHPKLAVKFARWLDVIAGMGGRTTNLELGFADAVARAAALGLRVVRNGAERFTPKDFDGE
ncbi:KilA-N domain-containing protein [Pseudomonas palmensis]|uniref:KilA-N domain-containing protein n=1 Tax=Pseudomonas palmensis TaxID=2815362 RepID=UPI003CE6FAC8